jgi:hypothetical protein
MALGDAAREREAERDRQALLSIVARMRDIAEVQKFASGNLICKWAREIEAEARKGRES